MAESNGSLLSFHLQGDCQEPGPAPEPYTKQSSMGYLYLFWTTRLCVCMYVCMYERLHTSTFCTAITKRTHTLRPQLTNLFHFHQIQQETLVIEELLELPQLLQMRYPLVANFLSHKDTQYTRLTHTRLTALFRDYPGEPVPER